MQPEPGDINALFENADDDLFDGVAVSPGYVPAIEPAEIASILGTPAGQRLMHELHRQFVYVTIVEPGQPPEVHGIRQGQANVVFWLADQIAAAHKGD